MTEWLGDGLQNHLRGFESRSELQIQESSMAIHIPLYDFNTSLNDLFWLAYLDTNGVDAFRDKIIDISARVFSHKVLLNGKPKLTISSVCFGGSHQWGEIFGQNVFECMVFDISRSGQVHNSSDFFGTVRSTTLQGIYEAHCKMVNACVDRVNKLTNYSHNVTVRNNLACER